ncbi:hypothetical protein JIN84_05965 [Luteolibacter yonseiensis]|uniref:Uncharacterized protein n=1 Tax=Luteolibacter yonseiensis TaxID=1144680 RepID=A0A934QYP6_9BACT|nr:hypothetical protein [Luteolibacter yonseiensis]MBK1815148.1 hypothetical protein [Luteolibacter yonseiensis]
MEVVHEFHIQRFPFVAEGFQPLGIGVPVTGEREDFPLEVIIQIRPLVLDGVPELVA